MTIEEANKIIAEFMGLEFKAFYISAMQEPMFAMWDGSVEDGYNSLDDLVPVWEKLGYDSIDIGHLSQPQMNGNSHRAYIRGLNGKGQGEGSSIQEAAAIATAKAIQEQEKDK